MGTTSKQRSPRALRFAMVALCVAIVAFFFFLLITNYQSQVNLHEVALEHFRHNTARSADAVSYFFAERKHDIQDLAASRVVSIFLENKALGMSVEYGLGASLLGISEYFDHIIDKKRIGTDRIYTRMLFVDSDGELAVDSKTTDHRPGLERHIFNDLLTPEGLKAVIITEGSKIAISVPIIWKNHYTGQIVAWVNPRSVHDNFLKTDETSRFVGMVSGKDNFYVSEEMPWGLLYSSLSDIRRTKDGETCRFDLTHHDGTKMEMIAIQVPVGDTPLSLISVLSSREVFGRMSPWQLLLAMGVLSFSAFGGLVLVWRINNGSLVLQARLDEASKREQEIEDKNRQLKEEILRRRRAEEKLKDYSVNLEKMVEDRTGELTKALEDLQNTQSQLLQSEKMASIGQLAAGVAHEINNPVGFVKSNLGTMNEYREDLVGLFEQYQLLETALKEQKDGPVREALQDIEKVKEEIDLDFILDDYQKVIAESIEGTARVAKIVSDLKDFAHLDKAELEETDINKGIESTLNIVRNELKYKTEVIKDLGDIPLVKCYPQRLNQVFMNIFVNAAHAIEDKGTIRISTGANNGHVEIRISDTGSGISPEILPKIFDPFFTTKEVGKGTGLGLNMVYNIIQDHKGTIDVESEVGTGTTFIMRLQINPDIEAGQ